MTSAPLHSITLRILAHLRERLGAGWDRLEQPDRELITACAADAAALHVRALATPQTPDAQLRLLKEKAQIQAQLANLTAAGAARIAHHFWDAVRNTVNGAVAVAFAAL